VGCAKYTGVGEKEGNINVTVEDEICKSDFSLDLIRYFCTDVLSAPWLLIYGDFKHWLKSRTVMGIIRSVALTDIFEVITF
jgi:hypothetical protein